jgi:RNA polymerase sigma-70 factor, ECF subfamily
MAETSHPTLLAAAAAGDAEALASLVRLHHDRVYRYGLRVCRDGFDADDAVQEAFFKLAKRPDVAGDPGALAWLLTVVKNACLRLLRPLASQRRALGERVDEAELPAGELSPEAALQRWELVRSVHAAIATLDPKSREVLVLRDLEGLSGPEAAVHLGLDEAAMKTRLHRARVLLRRELERQQRQDR